MKPKRLDNKLEAGSQLNLEALYTIAPSCFTEVQDPKTGETKHVVNFDTLRTLLGDDAVVRIARCINSPGRASKRHA